MIGGLFIFSKKYLNLNDFEKSMFLSIINRFLRKVFNAFYGLAISNPHHTNNFIYSWV